MMKLSTKSFVILTLLFVFAVGTVLFGMKNGWFEPASVATLADDESESVDSEPAKRPKVPSLAEALNVPPEDITIVGGVPRSKRDIGPNAVGKRKKAPRINAPKRKSAGSSPALKGNENPQVAGLMAELKQDRVPAAAVTTYAKPEPFDAEAYAKDPASYLNKIRPGRVHQTAQPGPDVEPLRPDSNLMNEVIQGERVVLRVKASPGNPVTFYTPQVGEFDNRLSTYSVAANDEGVATATYFAGPGTQGIIDIVAASPLHSGQTHFFVNVEVPR